jgi:ligand-binding SRPBCC domain-containing protein
MRIFQFDAEQWLPHLRQEVFAFFADPQNLETITPPWLEFEIKTRGHIEMRQGAIIDYRLRLHGVSFKWRSEITVWDPPLRFVDVQVRGPYRLWRHQHIFEESGGHTRICDHVEYAVPGGRLVQKFMVARNVERIFEFRRHKLEKIFSSGHVIQ